MKKLKALKERLYEEGSYEHFGVNTYSLLKGTVIPLFEEVYQELDHLKDSHKRKEGP